MTKRGASETFELPVETRDGEFRAYYSEAGLCGLSFPQPERGGGAKAVEAPVQVKKWHALTERSVKACLEGRAPSAFPPLDLRSGTPFQRQVWETMRTIAPGKQMSYQELAAAIGNPKATRAVGGACGANPIPVLIPCHRVLAAHRRLGGFSGGLDWKRKLLARENVEFFGDETLD